MKHKKEEFNTSKQQASTDSSDESDNWENVANYQMYLNKQEKMLNDKRKQLKQNTNKIYLD